jgi:hypothetical protein
MLTSRTPGWRCPTRAFSAPSSRILRFQPHPTWRSVGSASRDEGQCFEGLPCGRRPFSSQAPPECGCFASGERPFLRGRRSRFEGPTRRRSPELPIEGRWVLRGLLFARRRHSAVRPFGAGPAHASMTREDDRDLDARLQPTRQPIHFRAGRSDLSGRPTGLARLPSREAPVAALPRRARGGG